MTRNPYLQFAIVFGLPVVYSLLVRLLYGLDSNSELLEVMTIGFLIFLPLISGWLTVYFSSLEYAQKTWYRIVMPWFPVYLFMLITLVWTLEGWACWMMAMPLFMAFASVGGVLGGMAKARKYENKTYISLLLLLPFVISFTEQSIGASPKVYEAYTYIDIDASAALIWNNVTKVPEIPENQDKGWLTRSLGFPRPVKAELDFAGVGGSREAIFTNGLVFHETVTEYIDQQKMVFTIKAFPHEIPSTTMDEHVVIGGDYFDVIDGTYELEKLDENTHRLHLYSHFKLTTTFNFYASWWARWIMQDIQNNILQVEKQRAEHLN